MTEVFILLALILANGLFTMSEIALVSARKGRLESLANKGDLKAKVALDLTTNPEKFLSTAQIGITLISIITGVYSGNKFGRDIEPIVARIDLLSPYAATISTVLVVIVVTFLSIIFGELIPKKFGLLRAEKISRMVAGPMNFLSKLGYPFVWTLSNVTNLIFKLFNVGKATDSAVTEEEIKQMVSEGSEFGSIEEGERDIIQRVFHRRRGQQGRSRRWRRRRWWWWRRQRWPLWRPWSRPSPHGRPGRLPQQHGGAVCARGRQRARPRSVAGAAVARAGTVPGSGPRARAGRSHRQGPPARPLGRDARPRARARARAHAHGVAGTLRQHARGAPQTARRRSIAQCGDVGPFAPQRERTAVMPRS